MIVCRIPRKDTGAAVISEVRLPCLNAVVGGINDIRPSAYLAVNTYRAYLNACRERCLKADSGLVGLCLYSDGRILQTAEFVIVYNYRAVVELYYVSRRVFNVRDLNIDTAPERFESQLYVFRSGESFGNAVAGIIVGKAVG